MKKSISGLLTVIILTVALHTPGQAIEKFLPSTDELRGWKITEGPKVYVGDYLFDLIDGGADLYYEYGFNRVLSVLYADPLQNTIQAEIYEMSDAPSAYGIFSLTQQAVGWSEQYGSLSVVADDYISFWKNRYYVTLSWSSRQHHNQHSLEELAEAVSLKIPGNGKYPDIVVSFQPVSGGENAIYLKGNTALSNFYYFDYKDIFEIREAVAGSAGKYNRIIIGYPDSEQALRVLAEAKQSILNNKRFTDVAMAFQGFSFRDNKGNFILVRQVENYIAILVAMDADISIIPVMDDITLKIENRPR